MSHSSRGTYPARPQVTSPANRFPRGSHADGGLHRFEHGRRRYRLATPGDHRQQQRPVAGMRSRSISRARGLKRSLRFRPCRRSPRPVIIDGYTQERASPNTNTTIAAGDNAVLLIGLNGNGQAFDGLAIAAGDSTVRGLIAAEFSTAGGGHSSGKLRRRSHRRRLPGHRCTWPDCRGQFLRRGCSNLRQHNRWHDGAAAQRDLWQRELRSLLER